jgi:hypothetical protein
MWMELLIIIYVLVESLYAHIFEECQWLNSHTRMLIDISTDCEASKIIYVN